MKTFFETLLRRRLQVFFFFGLLVALGIYLLRHLPVDAVPDITNVQVMINSKTGSLDPEQIEKTVTLAIEIEMAGLPGLQEIRSISKYGLSQVNLIFEDGTDLHQARVLTSQRMQKLSSVLPRGVTSEMAPPTTGLGEVYMYVLKSKPNSPKSFNERLIALKMFQDKVVRPELKKIPGVGDIDTNGGYDREVHLKLDPQKMQNYGIRIDQIAERINTLGENFGGSYIERNKTQIIVKTSSPVDSLEALKRIPLRIGFAGKDILLSDVAEVSFGKPLRVGAATAFGDEVVLGTVLMNVGANSKAVAEGVDEKIKTIALPEDIELHTVYSRSYLVNQTIKTVFKNLSEGAVLVILVLLIFLGRIPVALLVAMAIPLSMVFAAISMREFGVTANLMSLGALDFGLLVDGSVVFVENILRRIQGSKDNLKEKVIAASVEVSRPVFLGLVIIVLVYVPIFALEGTEGKLFYPMALTVISALIGSLVVAFILMPVLGYSLVQRFSFKESKETRIFAWASSFYKKTLGEILKKPALLPAIAVFIFGIAVIGFFKTGSEFVPQLSEGDLVLGIARDSKISLTQAIEEQKEVENVIAQFPEVEHVFSRIGTPESATDPMGVHLADTFIILKKGFSGRQPDELISDLEKSIHERFPSSEISPTQPIEMRFNEMLEGSRADISLRFYGPDLKQLLQYVEKSVEIFSQMPEIREVHLDALTALKESPAMDVKLDFKKMSDANVSLESANVNLRSFMAGEPLGFFTDGIWRYPILLRLADDYREDPQAIEKLPISTMDGGTIPLKSIAQIQIEDRVTTIARSFGQRYGAVSIFLKGTDISGVVAKAKDQLNEKLKVTSEYRMEWGGQFKNLERARQRLMIIIPFTLLIIFLLIWNNFRSLPVTFIILSAVPFAVSGGWIALWIAQIDFSVSAAVGFIALMGIAVLNSMVLIEFILHLAESKPMDEAVSEGAFARLRPVLMTALVAAFGFLPMVFGHGIGSEVQKPLATVVVGGIFTATLSTLFVVPYLVKRWGLSIQRDILSRELE
ncbi:MAG: CusA/CzcA family heavy metal efflux RND transporter [Bdellovibrionales bacterium]|nr:CusA/CzcA family heavy metal efflux RND transporter [Bdellovibrionales bacterium]